MAEGRGGGVPAGKEAGHESSPGVAAWGRGGEAGPGPGGNRGAVMGRGLLSGSIPE